MKKIIFTLIFVFLLLLPLELVSRAYWVKEKRLSFWAPEAMEMFYPALKKVHDTKITVDDGYYDILLLGGSVLYDAGRWSDAITVLRDTLKNLAQKREIRIHNVARPSHSSRDSLFKYRDLADKHFDLVIIYDSINEVRANNCPPDMFKADYSHYSWYKKLNFFEHYPLFKVFTLPYTIYSLIIDIEEKKGLIKFVPTDIPNEDWVKYGNDIKSASSFESNLNEILNLAKKRHEPVLMSTFAFYVPRDYSYFKFKTHQLNYAEHTFYIEVWGKPEHVIMGTLKHNDIMRKLSAEHPDVIFLDEYPRMPPGKEYYNDICHLTDLGIKKLLEDFSEAIVARQKN